MVTVIAPQPSVSERAADEIRAAILNGSLGPGARIRQEELAANLGVSREPVRQALLVLEKEGLICSTANRGASVAPVDLRLINDIYKFREAIDSYVAAEVAASDNFDPTRLREIMAQARSALRVGALDRLIELDLDFHSELYRGSGNVVLVEVMRTQWAHIRRAMTITLSNNSYRRQVWTEHAAVAKAIISKQTSRARALAGAHARAAREFVTAGLQNRTK
jgi:DNA-binding GntR family transcriptional regulator